MQNVVTFVGAVEGFAAIIGRIRGLDGPQRRFFGGLFLAIIAVLACQSIHDEREASKRGQLAPRPFVTARSVLR